MIIHKQQILGSYPKFTLSLPVDATILTVRIQHGIPTIWYSHSKENAISVTKLFMWKMTGLTYHDSECTQYIGTIETDEKEIIHLFMGN